MKRARRAAIVESSGSETDSDSGDSDFGESLGAKLKRKNIEAENAGKNVKLGRKKSDDSPLKKARTVKSESSKPSVNGETTSKTIHNVVKRPKVEAAKKAEDKVKPLKEAEAKALQGSEVSNGVSEKSNPHKSTARDGGRPDDFHPWSISEVVAAELGCTRAVAEATCGLLEAGNSLPFIARYRREATGGMGPDMLRKVLEFRESLVEVKEKCKKLMSSVEKVGKLTAGVRQSFLCCQTLAELEAVNAPYKTGSKASLAERARKLGLEDIALEILEGQPGIWKLPSRVQLGVQGLATIEEVTLGVQHIISDIMVHDMAMVDLIRKLQKTCHLVVESKQAKVVKSKEKEAKAKPPVDISKFENYFDYTCPAKYIKPHQVLALNRGESLKALSVKINVPDAFLHQLQGLVGRRWLHKPWRHAGREELIKAALEDAYKRLVVPQVQRQTRAALTKTAEEASITVFLENLRALLLAPPHRGQTLLAIDPGF